MFTLIMFGITGNNKVNIDGHCILILLEINIGLANLRFTLIMFGITGKNKVKRKLARPQNLFYRKNL